MNVKILFAYMEKCEVLGVEPTWEGLKFYKETGLINSNPKPFEFNMDLDNLPVRQPKVFKPVQNRLTTGIMSKYCQMCEEYGIEPNWEDAIKLQNMLQPPKSVSF